MSKRGCWERLLHCPGRKLAVALEQGRAEAHMGNEEACTDLKAEVASEALQGAALQRRGGPQVQVVQPRERCQERHALCAGYHGKSLHSCREVI